LAEPPARREGRSYVTDEVFFFRVARRVTDETAELVELEDCYGLDVVRVPSDQLQARRLRVVMPVPTLRDE